MHEASINLLFCAFLVPAVVYRLGLYATRTGTSTKTAAEILIFPFLVCIRKCVSVTKKTKL